MGSKTHITRKHKAHIDSLLFENIRERRLASKLPLLSTWAEARRVPCPAGLHVVRLSLP